MSIIFGKYGHLSLGRPLIIHVSSCLIEPKRVNCRRLRRSSSAACTIDCMTVLSCSTLPRTPLSLRVRLFTGPTNNYALEQQYNLQSQI